MHLVYIDESIHERQHYIYSALIVNLECWRETVDKIHDLRCKMRKHRGIYIAKELHASEFVAGKGKISSKILLKPERAEIFIKIMQFIADLSKKKQPDQIALINVVNSTEQYAFERLVNRINTTMKAFNSQAILIFDAGHEGAFIKRIRKMKIYNPIPSNQGEWESGSWSKNITIDRIIEDPFFKDSKQSNLIQMVDFVAYALLRKEFPLASKTALGLHKAFDILMPICFKAANSRDEFGIVR